MSVGTKLGSTETTEVPAKAVGKVFRLESVLLGGATGRDRGVAIGTKVALRAVPLAMREDVGGGVSKFSGGFSGRSDD